MATLKAFFTGFKNLGTKEYWLVWVSKDFWFSKFNIKHNVGHILVGALVANVVYVVYHVYSFSFVSVLIIALVSEYKDLDRNDWDFWNYQPQDQVRDIITWMMGACTVLFWMC